MIIGLYDQVDLVCRIIKSDMEWNWNAFSALSTFLSALVAAIAAWFTFRAAKAAEKSAKSAEESNKIAFRSFDESRNKPFVILNYSLKGHRVFYLQNIGTALAKKISWEVTKGNLNVETPNVASEVEFLLPIQSSMHDMMDGNPDPALVRKVGIIKPDIGSDCDIVIRYEDLEGKEYGTHVGVKYPTPSVQITLKS